jgi:hypothetical protein
MEWQGGIKQSYFEKRHKDWWSCAICCLYYVLKKTYPNLKPQNLLTVIKKRHSLNCLKKYGLSISEILITFECFGYQCEYQKTKGFDNSLSSLGKASPDKPILIFPENHAVVVLEMDERWIYYVEPDQINLIVSCVSHTQFWNYCRTKDFLEVLFLYPPSRTLASPY